MTTAQKKAPDSMLRPTVAIVMLNYNHARYLRESLGGICGQTRPADEIIVIDDCSTDNSVEIITGFAAGCPSMHFARNEHRLGVQDSIARALALVKSDYFVWTAADDRLLPNFLYKSMALLERHPQAGLCFSETTELRGDTGETVRFATEPTVCHIFDLRDLPEYMAPADIARRMKREYLPIAGNTVIVRRELLMAAGGYLRQLEWHSDYFAYTVIALRHGACVVAETLALIRATPGSYSQAMRDPARQTVVLGAMLDLLASREFRDVRRVLRRCPSYFSPWHSLMLKMQLGKVRDWDLFFPYLIWKIRELKRGHQLSWTDTFFHLLRRAIPVRRLIPVRFAARLFPDLVAERDRLAQRLGDLTAERDGAANALMEARRELQTAGAERDGLHNELERVRQQYSETLAQRDGVANELERVRQQYSETLAQRDGVGNELERVRREAAWMARRHGEVLAQRDGVANELERLRTEVLGETQQAEGSQGQRDGLSAENDQKRFLAKRWLPPMLVTTMPKSGTYYISKLFSEGLSIESRIVSHQYFPEDVIRQTELRMLSMGNCISQDHFGPSRINITHIQRHVNRMLVHLRDPRQALLSYVHFLDSENFRKDEDATMLFVYPPLPADFYRRDLSSKIDWAIESWLPLLLEWTAGWVIAADQDSTLRIKFTRYEDLVEDLNKFVSEVLDFFDIPQAYFTFPDIAPDAEIHFRKGEIDEWLQVFSAAQTAAANALIPAALASRFGWPLPEALTK